MPAPTCAAGRLRVGRSQDHDGIQKSQPLLQLLRERQRNMGSRKEFGRLMVRGSKPDDDQMTARHEHRKRVLAVMGRSRLGHAQPTVRQRDGQQALDRLRSRFRDERGTG